MFDLIIKKATVINGKNEKPFVADVGLIMVKLPKLVI